MAHRPRRISALTLGLLALALLVPLATVWALQHLVFPSRVLELRRFASRFAPSERPFQASRIGTSRRDDPKLTHVLVFDLDRDGQQDVIACDAARNLVVWYRRNGSEWQERSLTSAHEVAAPAHATPVDLDADGDHDLVIAGLGSVWPTDGPEGAVVWLENDGQQQFTTRVLLRDVRRVTDVQPGDLDGDGDLDLVVAEFGYHRGSVLWLENQGEGRFLDHQLLAAPGAVHVPVADFDGDGDLDVAAVVTQNEEEVWGFENLGGGEFQPNRRLIYGSVNFDLGCVGLVATDLDRDGDQDLLLATGDNFELIGHHPQPSHGCTWLENEGGWQFTPRRLVEFGGTYGVAPGDMDGDGDTDLALVSMFNDWSVEGAASLIWLENDGRQSFRPWQLAAGPIQLATVACGDVNGDGCDDIIAGGVHITRPHQPLGHLLCWLSGTAEDSSSGRGDVAP